MALRIIFASAVALSVSNLGGSARREISLYLRAVAPRTLRGLAAKAVPLGIPNLRWFRGEHGPRLRNRAANGPTIGTVQIALLAIAELSAAILKAVKGAPA